MKHPWLPIALGLMLPALALAQYGPAATAADPGRPDKDHLITKDGVAGVASYMQAGEVRNHSPGICTVMGRKGRILIGGKHIANVTLTEPVGTAVYTNYSTTDLDRETPPESGMTARIGLIEVFDPAYATAEGLRPGMPVADAVNRAGGRFDIRLKNGEEVLRFKSGSLADIRFVLAAPDGRAGIYPPRTDDDATTAQYVPEAKIKLVRVGYGW